MKDFWPWLIYLLKSITQTPGDPKNVKDIITFSDPHVYIAILAPPFPPQIKYNMYSLPIFYIWFTLPPPIRG